jgi:signal transduction histidine kinase
MFIREKDLLERVRDDWSPAKIAARAAAIQGALVLGLWIVLGYWNARHAWLLEPGQQNILRIFFWRELPVLGFVLLVALPAIRAYRIADEATLDVEHESEFVDRILAFPRAVAILDMAGSVGFFFLGALQLRIVGNAPALEAAKIIVFGFLAGVLFGIASFLFLQPVLRPLLLAAARRGQGRSRPPAFPLTQKIVVACLAIAFVVTGLFGEIALSWAQRFSEARAQENAQDRLRSLAADVANRSVRDAASCRAWLAGAVGKSEGATFAVLSSSGLLVASWPPRPKPPDGGLIASQDWREAAAKLGDGAHVSRWGDPRVVTSATLSTGWKLVSLTPPDPAVLRAFLVSVVPVAVEIFAISIGLAWAVGRGLSGPLRTLELRARQFGEDPHSPWRPLATTDDEIGRLTDSFRRMEEEIRTVEAQLRETERRAATAELLAGVAHEVRNPLFGITSTAAALEGELAGNEAVAPHLAIIRKESDRLSRMMEEMLALQRMPNRGTVPVPILPVLDDAAASIRSRLSARSPQIVVDSPFDLEVAHADRDRLESVFGNLFENAVLSSEVPVHIAVRARRDQEQAVIEVEDDGPGLPSAVRDRVFEPFVTSRAGGTGIGLAVSRQIVLEHGGTIDVKSPEGGPTVFTLRLPAA